MRLLSRLFWKDEPVRAVVEPMLELTAVEVPTQHRREPDQTTQLRIEPPLMAANSNEPELAEPTPPKDDPLEKWPPSYHAVKFLEWLQDGTWGASAHEQCGLEYNGSDAIFGVHRWWECPESGDLFAEILCCDVSGAYMEFCADELVEPCKWNTLATHLNRLLHGDRPGKPLKPYTQVVDEDTGATHRLRCYRIPVPVTFEELAGPLRKAA